MRIRRFGPGVLAATLIAPLTMAQAQQPTIDELLQRLDAQEQAIKVLERRLELKEEADATAAKSAGQVKASERGFTVQSADGKNQIKLRGVLHVDGRHMVSDEADLPDTYNIQRARPILEGTLGGIYDFRFMPDFGQGRTVIQDAYVTGRFAPSFAVTAGKYKSPVGLERLQSATDIRFVQRAFPTSLAPNRDIGFKVEGNVLDDRLTYAVAFVNGSNDGSSSETFTDTDVTSDKEYVARLFAHPFASSDSFKLRGLGLGIAGTYTEHTGNATQTFLPSFRTPAQATFFRHRGGTTPAIADGERTRLAPQFYYYAGRFGLLGEYTEVSQDVSRETSIGLRSDTIDTTAWQLAASFFLTGEEATYRGYKPNSSFSLEDGTWGAFELTARYHELEVDDAAFAGGTDSFADPEAAARKASAFTVGLNWYLSQNLKWVINYERTSFEGGAAGGADRDDEEAVFTRVAVGF
jgi:phosphate-selective porin OprO and OprP